MNIAICLTGLSRNYKDCFPTIIKNIVEANPAHIFSFYVATWNINDSNKSFSGKQGTEFDIDEMIKIINPINYQIFNLEEYIQAGYFNLRSYKIIPHIDNRLWDENFNHYGLMQFFLKKECIKLVNKNIDNVFFLRFDCAMLDPFFLKTPKENEIYVNIGTPCPPNIRCDDGFMYGSLKNAIKYANVFKNSYTILNKLNCLEENERVLFENLRIENLQSTPLLLHYKKI